MGRFKSYGERGLFDEFMQNLDVAAFETPLLRVGKIVEWEIFEPIVKEAINRKVKGPGGRPRFHPLLMFKVLVLQRLHGLADDATSFQITDRNSFRAFLGLTPGDEVPDGQTISDFRETLMKAGSMDALFNTFLLHLQKKHGLALAKEGVMVDASFCEVPRQRNSREDNAQIKAGEVPERLKNNAKVRAHKDLDGRWTKKDFQTYYGYKNHIKADVRDKLILKAVVSTANVHDSQVLEKLIDEKDRKMYADSAYQGAHLESMAAEKGIQTQICEKGSSVRPLSDEQKANNRQKSKTRARVEHVFAQMTGSMKALYQRCIGLQRNTAGLMLTNLVYNLLRFEQIKRLKLADLA